MVSGGPLRGTFDEHLGERRRVVITGVGAVTAAGLTGRRLLVGAVRRSSMHLAAHRV